MSTTETALVPQQPTPMAMLQIAVSQGADLDKIAKLMDLQERWERNEAKKAFIAAKAEFKSKPIKVAKNKDNKQYGSKYTTLDNLVNTVNPYLSECGLEASWAIDQTNGIKVTCTLTHVLGHSESVSMICPPDKSGAKNPIQEIKSAITYAKACTFESICGLASTDANLDDDGNGAYGGDLAERVEWIENACNLKELQTLFTDAYNKAKAANDKHAMAALIQAKDKRKAELK